MPVTLEGIFSVHRAFSKMRSPEGAPELFPINPGLFEDAIQGASLQFPVQRYRKDPPPLLHDNMGRGLPLRNETMPGKVLHHLFPGDNRQLMRHQLRQLSISRDGQLMPADAPLSTAPQEQVLSLL